MGLCSFVSLWKICLYWFIPNCTQNHVITYTNKHFTVLVKATLTRWNQRRPWQKKSCTTQLLVIMILFIWVRWGLFTVIIKLLNMQHVAYKFVRLLDCKTVISILKITVCKLVLEGWHRCLFNADKHYTFSEPITDIVVVKYTFSQGPKQSSCCIV